MRLALCTFTVPRGFLLSIWLTVSGWASVRACSFEILPIESVVPSAHLIVIGIVDSVRVEVTPEGTEPVWTDIQVEQVLQGDVEPGPLRLHFAEGVFSSTSSCAYLVEPYYKSNRLLLMVTEERQGSYFAPAVPPCLIELGQEPSALTSDLVKFISYTIAHRISPIQIEFHGPARFSSNKQATLLLTVTNNMEVPVTVVTKREGHQSQSGVVVWFSLYSTRDEDVKPKVECISAPLSISPGKSADIILDLATGHPLTEPYRYHLRFLKKLPAGAAASYVDFSSSVLSSVLEDRSRVSRTSWGQVKQNFQ